MMIGKAGAALDRAQLCTLCQERKVEHGRTHRAEVISKLDEIARNCGPHSGDEEEVARPYGVVHEGQALDVWGHILEKVTDPSEIGNLRKVCKMFQDILRNKYIQTRLPEVVKFLLEKYPNYLLIPDVYNGFRGKRKARIRTFVNMRLVCKQSKKSLENIPLSERLGLGLTCLTLKTTEQVHRIVETLSGNPSFANSFFPNDLIIYEKDMRRDLQQFHKGILVFLKLVGHRISRFEYWSFLDLQAEAYACIRTWAELMPNLKHLRVGEPHWIMHDEHVPSLQETEVMPALPLLQSYECLGLYAPYVQRILEANPNIGHLRLNQYMNAAEYSPLVLETAMNVTSLKIHLYPALLQYRDFQWKLNKLVFHSQELAHIADEPSRNPRDRISTSIFFPFLKQFEGTLEYLDFDRTYLIHCGEYLELRNLKTLIMELHDDSFENLNFLLYAEKLETLRVKLGHKLMENLLQAEKLRRILEGSFLGRSVWDVFPYLKRLQLRIADHWNRSGEMLEQFRML